MDTILTVLKSIDFWTIIGAIGSVAGAVFAVFSLTRFNKKSAIQERTDELKLNAKSIEGHVNELIACYSQEGKSWERHASVQPSPWKPTEEEFKKYLVDTLKLHVVVARELDVLFQQNEVITEQRFQVLRNASRSLAKAIDDKMTFRVNTDYLPLWEAVQNFQRARLRL